MIRINSVADALITGMALVDLGGGIKIPLPIDGIVPPSGASNIALDTDGVPFFLA
jgi:hypothetical protein